MNTYQIGAAALGVGLLWASRYAIRSVVQRLFPQGLPGEPNTALLATARSTSASAATAKDLQDVVEYDYIIIGTGTAGCVLANRLTADGRSKVLAIEAGHSDVKQLMSRIPAGMPKLFKTPADWAFTTTPQAACKDRALDWPRGKMIGGCSSINAMMYTRGAPDDYDEWEQMGNKGWGYRDLVKYMKRAEKFRQPREDSGKALPSDVLAQHGDSGPWNIGYTYQAKITNVFPDACSDIGVPKVSDINSDKGMAGATWVQTFIDDKGQRSSTAVAYLTADVVRRPNLKIASGQNVTRIIFDTTGSQPRAVGVEMAASQSATVRYVAKARKEVILCGGSVGTPQLLKLSGIGPAKELQEHNIALVKELPGVGENLSDHIAYHGVTFKVDKKFSTHYLQDPLKSLPDSIEWLRHGTGAATTQACDSVAFLRTAFRDDAPASLKAVDHSSGPGGADLELMAISLCFTGHGDFIAPQSHGYGSLSAVGLRPESRGTVKLASLSPFAAPLIDPKSLSTDYDLDVLLYGVRQCVRIARSPSYKPYFQGWYNGPYHPLDWDTVTDEEIREHIRATCETLYHPMGTAKMGKKEDRMAVVDDELKVHGVQGLRIVDASVFPTPLACHTCAPVVMAAEKAADMILGV